MPEPTVAPSFPFSDTLKNHDGSLKLANGYWWHVTYLAQDANGAVGINTIEISMQGIGPVDTVPPIQTIDALVQTVRQSRPDLHDALVLSWSPYRVGV